MEASATFYVKSHFQLYVLMANMRLRGKAASDTMFYFVGKSHNEEVHQLIPLTVCTNIDSQ